jgi:hypothetical protein
MLAQAGCSEDECATAGAVASSATAITVTSSCDGEHTHDFTIMNTDLVTPPATGVAGNTTAYEGGHVHTIALTAAELAQIQGGTTVSKVSGSAEAHTHMFDFRKA